MTTAYTSLLGLALPVTGELSGTWGDTVNNSITSLLDTSVAGTTNISADSNVTLTTTTGASNEARQAILLFSGARTAVRTVTAPAQSKIYTVINATTGGYAVTLVGAGPTTGVTIANGARTVVAWNGSDFVEVSSPSSIILPGGTANGVLYLNGSKVATSGSALTFDGTNLTLGANTFVVKNATGDTNGLRIYQAASDVSSIFNYYNGAIAFGINNAEQMRLTSTGLGIGTSSPSAKLNVVGSGDMSGIFESTGTSNAASLIVRSGNGTTSGLYAYARFVNNDSNAQDWRIGTYGTNNLSIVNAKAGTTPVVLDSSGNLGLGVTPSAWGGGYKAFQITNEARSLAATGAGAGDLTLAFNAVYDSTDSRWEYTTTGDKAGRYSQTGAGNHAWYVTNTTGTAGNAITFSQAMTLTASGNLGIGSTGPVSKLEVVNSGVANLYIGYNNTSFNYIDADNNVFRNGAGTERARIDSSGNFGVGTSSPQARLDVQGALAISNNSTSYWKLDRSDADGSLQIIDTSTERARITNGNLLIATTTSSLTSGDGFVFTADANNSGAKTGYSGNSQSCWNMYSTGASAYRFYVGWGGTVYATSTSISAISDQTLKTNIRDLETGLTEVMALKPRRFDWINDDATNVAGFIAQEVEQILPELVSDYEYSEGVTKKSLKMGDILPTLVKAIQEQQAIIESLKARLDAANL